MQRLKLIFPTLEMEKQAIGYRQEHFDCGEHEIHGDGGLDHATIYSEWIGKITTDLTRDEGTFVPATTYFAIIDDRIVGTIQIRHKLNDFLLGYGGHIGYGVRPSERRKGYATEMLALALEKSRELGITKALVTCDNDNIGSARTIIKNGGILENEITQEDGSVTQRYWITVSSVKTLTGKTITLRAVRQSDIDDRYAIGRHHEFIHMCGGETLKQTEYPDRSVWVNWYNHQKEQELSWIIDLDGKCIGGARLHNISEQDHSATYAIGIFDPAYHSKGIGTEATKLILQYAFEDLKLHRVDLKVLDYNMRGIRCYEKCGFKVDGFLRDSAFIEGQYYSDIVMSILENEWRT